jgi:hypothetical protein
MPVTSTTTAAATTTTANAMSSLLLSASLDGTVRTWTLQSATEQLSKLLESEAIGISSSCGDGMAGSSTTNKAAVKAAVAGKALQTFRSSDMATAVQGFWCMQVLQDSVVFAAGTGGQVYCWDIATGTELSGQGGVSSGVGNTSTAGASGASSSSFDSANMASTQYHSAQYRSTQYHVREALDIRTHRSRVMKLVAPQAGVSKVATLSDSSSARFSSQKPVAEQDKAADDESGAADDESGAAELDADGYECSSSSSVLSLHLCADGSTLLAGLYDGGLAVLPTAPSLLLHPDQKVRANLSQKIITSINAATDARVGTSSSFAPSLALGRVGGLFCRSTMRSLVQLSMDEAEEAASQAAAEPAQEGNAAEDAPADALAVLGTLAKADIGGGSGGGAQGLNDHPLGRLPLSKMFAPCVHRCQAQSLTAVFRCVTLYS